MIQTLFVSLAAGFGGLWLAAKFVPGVSFGGSWANFLIPGLILAIIIAILKPLLSLVSLIIKIIILGAVILGALWILHMLFPAITISGIVPLAWTAGIVAGLVIILSIIK